MTFIELQSQEMKRQSGNTIKLVILSTQAENDGQNATFSYKTALSEANSKTYRMRSAKWIHHKEWCFASNYFLKIYFILGTLYTELI